MATRGAKPKPSALRVVDGTRRGDRHGTEKELREKAEKSKQSFGELKKPTGMKGDALKAWKSFIEPATWLDGSRLPAAIAFCELWNEFRVNPMGFPASKHGQMRAYMSELGLTDERNRSDSEEKDEDEFFDD
ncbi:hypothetical protein [uncultured Microbulbifer sp.]|uniref:hypothetical protein n=1 Tax=uncultured Microbulbifer sp. TaxID=348147 RepID=UPI0025F53502|nr:hypothetical protein [uncultured Microbulbifer sp.]